MMTDAYVWNNRQYEMQLLTTSTLLNISLGQDIHEYALLNSVF